MDLRIGTEEAGSDLKVPHNLPHCSPLSPFLFVFLLSIYMSFHLDPLFSYVSDVMSIVLKVIHDKFKNILSSFFKCAMQSRLIKC